MKLQEITKIVSQTTSAINFAEFDIDNAQLVAHAEGGLPVIKAKNKNSSDTFLFFVVVDNKNVACVVGSMVNQFNHTFFVIYRAWTDPDYRLRGYMTALYVALVKHVGLKILSDKQQSPEMVSLWKQLNNIRPVKVIDTTTGTIIDRNQVTDTEVYNDGDQYRLLLEHTNDTWIPDIDSNVVADYMIYTHPDNTGKFE